MRINKENTKRIILIESTKLKYSDREFYIKLIEKEIKLQEDIKNFLNALSEFKIELRKNNYDV